MRKHNGMRPQDIVVLLKILTLNDKAWQFKDLSISLGISQAEITESLNRSDIAKLFNKSSRKLNRSNLYEFINYGLPYAFPQIPGTLVNGMPTAHSHPYFSKHFSSDYKFVWPHVNGKDRGLALEPFYKNQCFAAESDPDLYLMLACIDIIRVGKVREKEMAKEILKNKMFDELPGEYHKDQSYI
jgi:hypothetical protein